MNLTPPVSAANFAWWAIEDTKSSRFPARKESVSVLLREDAVSVMKQGVESRGMEGSGLERLTLDAETGRLRLDVDKAGRWQMEEKVRPDAAGKESVR